MAPPPLAFCPIDPAPVGIPPPRPNGGLYTGEPFRPGAGWANVPTVPDSIALLRNTLASANPPPGAAHQVPLDARPGNNTYSASYDSLGFAPLQGGSLLQCKSW